MMSGVIIIDSSTEPRSLSRRTCGTSACDCPNRFDLYIAFSRFSQLFMNAPGDDTSMGASGAWPRAHEKSIALYIFWMSSLLSVVGRLVAPARFDATQSLMLVPTTKSSGDCCPRRSDT